MDEQSGYVLYLKKGCQPGLEHNRELVVRAGCLKLRAAVRVAPETGGNWFRLSPALLRALQLPEQSLHGRYFPQSNEFRVGPVIGILAGRNRKGRFCTGSELARLSLLGNRIGALVYIFTPPDIDWKQNMVLGYRLDAATGRWQGGLYPLPDVVSNYLMDRKSELRYRGTCNRLRRITGNRFFNTRYFNKWQIYLMLKKSPELCPYLPETKLLQGVASLGEMLSRHGSVYLKPSGGSLGRGIMVVQEFQGGYLIKGCLHRAAPTLQEACQLILASKSGGSYLIQQDLRLARYRGRLFDIRVLMQKTGAGEWAVTKIFGRLAAEGGITSNLATGAATCDIYRVLSHICGSEKGAARTVEEIKRLAFSIAACLDRVSGLRLGELGLDLGIDGSQRLWIIEVNSKPRKSTRSQADRCTVNLPFLRLLGYAAHLAGFDLKTEDGGD